MTAPAQDLINYDAEFAKIAKETQEALTAPKTHFISTKGKIFTLPDGRPTPHLECIVVDFIRINTLMPPFNPNIRPTPKCWAYGRNDTQLTPSEHSPQRQAENCATCPQNKYGSATNGGRGKACTNTYRLAIIPPDATPESDILMLKISPTGLTRWSNYVRLIENGFGAGGFCRVITKLSFDPNKDFPSITFTPVGPVQNPETILKIRKRASEEIMTEPNITD